MPFAGQGRIWNNSRLLQPTPLNWKMFYTITIKIFYIKSKNRQLSTIENTGNEQRNNQNQDRGYFLEI